MTATMRASKPVTWTNERKATLVSTVMILALQILDLITTFAVLNKGSGQEMNPLADFLLGHELLGITLIWYPKILLPLSILAAVFTRHEQTTTTRLCVGYWVAGFYTMVVLNNTLVYYAR